MADDLPGIDLQQLVREHHAAVYRYALRLTGSAAEGEDLCQQVFLQACRAHAQLRTAAHARAWLFTILRHAWCKTCRKNAAQGEIAPLDVDQLPADLPDDWAVDRDDLQHALTQLAPEYRLVLLMYYFESLSYREIAEKLDLPLGTVMSRLSRAKGALRTLLIGPVGAGQRHA